MNLRLDLWPWWSACYHGGSEENYPIMKSDLTAFPGFLLLNEIFNIKSSSFSSKSLIS